MKWHPDKNLNIDTTQRMQLIIEAHLILKDIEARISYDKVYAKFKIVDSQKNDKSNLRKDENVSEENRKRGSDKYSNMNENYSHREEFSTFQFDDEVLKRWMNNARKQSIRNVNQMIIEFRESSIIGFGTFFKTALMVMIIAMIFFIIVVILK